MRVRYGPELAGRYFLPLETHLREGAALGLNEASCARVLQCGFFKSMQLSQQFLYAGIWATKAASERLLWVWGTAGPIGAVRKCVKDHAYGERNKGKEKEKEREKEKEESIKVPITFCLPALPLPGAGELLQFLRACGGIVISHQHRGLLHIGAETLTRSARSVGRQYEQWSTGGFLHGDMGHFALSLLLWHCQCISRCSQSSVACRLVFIAQTWGEGRWSGSNFQDRSRCTLSFSVCCVITGDLIALRVQIKPQAQAWLNTEVL